MIKIIKASEEFEKVFKKNNIEKEKFVTKIMPFYFDRGFCDGYRHYMAIFMLPKEKSVSIEYATLDFQCSVLKLYDKSENVVIITTTDSYASPEELEAHFLFEDDLDPNSYLIEELHNNSCEVYNS